MPNMMADRRVTLRYPLVVRAEVVELSGGAKLSARTSDLSRTGCYVDTLQPLLSGSAIRIRLTQGSESVEVHGKVRYVSPGMGMGVQFDDQISVEQLTILDSWLEAAAKQPA
jgi:hypothetical protein